VPTPRAGSGERRSFACTGKFTSFKTPEETHSTQRHHAGGSDLPCHRVRQNEWMVFCRGTRCGTSVWTAKTSSERISG
jgi:hypothetical protein